MQEENNPILPQRCMEFAERLELMAADELDREGCAQVEAHAASCAECARMLHSYREFDRFLNGAQREEPDAAFLASCRAGLEDALDREEEKGLLRRWADAVMPAQWLSPHPAFSAALLVAIGISIGTIVPRVMLHYDHPTTQGANQVATQLTTAARSGPGGDSGVTVGNPAGVASEPDWRTADVTGINWVSTGDNAPPRVEVQLKALRPLVVEGTVSNGNIEQVLLNILRNNQRYDADVRLDAVELLRPRNKESDVRQALCQTVRTDRNAAVRLKALEALSGSDAQDDVQGTLLAALVGDSNPGVRIEAINSLRAMAENGQMESDPGTMAILRERMHKDPSTYIRLQSAAAIRDLGPREKY
ncbi:MAG: HEAT repeat domain-containing protein [Candidatus Acidiferrales bacterium]